MEITKWLRKNYNKVTQSIAFYPAIIAVGFLLLSWVMIKIDFSPWGKYLKSQWSWVSLKDASTARSIISTIAGAIISLAVFSFSMVMIVLNQAASQMSNRVLTSMIENRFQQIILGCYIGTIVYSLFLLSTIRDINSGIYVPALSIYLLILLTVIDIFLFIYFLDYVTQTVKYDTVIHRVQRQTMNTMKNNFVDCMEETVDWKNLSNTDLQTEESNYFQGFNEKRLLKIAHEKDVFLSFLFKPGTFLIKGIPFITVYSKGKLDVDSLQDILSTSDFYGGQPIDKNADYGFSQLAEVAIKALSPGINDPATAVLSVHALSDLLSYRMYHHSPTLIKDTNEVARIKLLHSSFNDLFEKCIHPIWSYGKDDEYIQKGLLLMIDQLKQVDYKKQYSQIFDAFKIKIKSHQDPPIVKSISIMKS